MKTYSELSDLSEEMNIMGVNSLPLEFDLSDLAPFSALFAERNPSLTSSLSADLERIFDDGLEFHFESANIYIHDADAQGATYILYRIRAHNEDNSFLLSIRLTLFYNRITVRLINFNQHRISRDMGNKRIFKKLSKKDAGYELQELFDSL